MSNVLPLQNEDNIVVRLVDLVQRHNVRVRLGRLEHGDLVQDILSAVLAFPP